jgi:hypothetical protein
MPLRHLLFFNKKKAKNQNIGLTYYSCYGDRKIHFSNINYGSLKKIKYGSFLTLSRSVPHLLDW